MWEIFVHFLISVSKVKEIDSRECIPESIQIRRETQKSLRHTTMFTYSHANTPLGQSEPAYYLSYFIKHTRRYDQNNAWSQPLACNRRLRRTYRNL